MTLKEIEKLEKTMLTPSDVYGYLDTDPNTLRWQARTEPEKLGFPVIVLKSRIKIPKEAFINFCRHGHAEKTV